MAHVRPDIAEAVARLRAGGVVAFPTETVYGLGADALREDAVARVFALKGRPSRNPLIVHVLDEAMARSCAGVWPEEASRLARAFWPGPLSIVVPKAAHVPDIVTAGGPTVALRCPDHSMALALISAFGGPLVGPSANPSGRVSPTTAGHVREAFDEADVLVLDGGACRTGIESTVVAIDEGGGVRVLRPGVIGAEAIARVLAMDVVSRGEGDESIARSPGLIGPHYAPRARLVLFDDETWSSVANDAARSAGERSRPWMVVLSWRARSGPEGSMVMAMPRSAGEYARRLYAALREADALGPSVIAVETPQGGGTAEDRAIWEAVMDRLRRAAEGA